MPEARTQSTFQGDGSAAVEAVIRHHVLALNSGDEAAIAADWAEAGTLVDAFPPFVWDGDSPTTKWWRDLQSSIGPAGLDRVEFALGDWQRIYVHEDSAYVAVDATAVVSGVGIAVEARGTWTFVLRRSGQAWRIVSWNWGGPPAAPVRR